MLQKLVVALRAWIRVFRPSEFNSRRIEFVGSNANPSLRQPKGCTSSSGESSFQREERAYVRGYLAKADFGLFALRPIGQLHCFLFAAIVLGLSLPATLCAESPSENLDPTAWGSNHIGKPFPDYVTGDECLFCHRDVGPTWPENRHTLTIRPIVELNNSATATLQMGNKRIKRLLRRSKEYGKLDLFDAKFTPNQELSDSVKGHWDRHTFADKCAGCHTTAVETESKAFSALSVDCMTCHGDVDLRHSKDNTLVLLSKTNQKPQEVISICGQCHLRGGKSKSTGLPWPNMFLAGDNLFKDYEVDLSASAISKLDPVERHVFETTRDVALLGKTQTTCLSCHDVHTGSSQKHQELDANSNCQTCHGEGNDSSHLTREFLHARGPSAQSHVCDYP